MNEKVIVWLEASPERRLGKCEYFMGNWIHLQNFLRPTTYQTIGHDFLCYDTGLPVCPSATTIALILRLLNEDDGHQVDLIRRKLPEYYSI